MSFQLVGVGEARLTQVAAVGPLASVHPEVSPEVGDLDEMARAMRTAVGLLTRVQPKVGLKVVVAGETFVTLAALEGLLSRVGSFVVL